MGRQCGSCSWKQPVADRATATLACGKHLQPCHRGHQSRARAGQIRREKQQQQEAKYGHARTLHQQHMAAGCAMGSARNAPENNSAHPLLLRNRGAQWQFPPTERGAQSPRNALKQLLKNLRGAQWSRGCTVYSAYSVLLAWILSSIRSYKVYT